PFGKNLVCGKGAIKTIGNLGKFGGGPYTDSRFRGVPINGQGVIMWTCRSLGQGIKLPQTIVMIRQYFPGQWRQPIKGHFLVLHKVLIKSGRSSHGLGSVVDEYVQPIVPLFYKITENLHTWNMP